MRQKFRILTINTWLLQLPFGVSIAPEIDERARLLPRLVHESGADIVLCQEVWHPKHRKFLREQFALMGYGHEASASPHLNAAFPGQSPGTLAGLGMLFPLSMASVFPTGPEMTFFSAFCGGALGLMASGSLVVDRMRKALGNGLQIFSKYPLDPQVDVMHFSTWTRPDELFIAKGAIRARANVPDLGWIDVFNSHLGAVSFDSRKQAYDEGQSSRREAQANELSSWMARTRTSEFAVLGVDLNAAPVTHGDPSGRASAEYELFSEKDAELGFVDTFQVAGYDPQGFTDDSRNPYKRSGMFANSPDARIDYVFSSRSDRVRPVRSEVAFDAPLASLLPHLSDQKVPTRISDHYGVMTEFEVSRAYLKNTLVPSRVKFPADFVGQPKASSTALQGSFRAFLSDLLATGNFPSAGASGYF